MTANDCLPHHVTSQMCSGPISDPRILPCMHSFCCQCLHMEIERVEHQKSLQCPTCLRNVPIPVGGASAFPQNLHLGFEVEVAGYMSKFASSSGMSCTFCVKGCNDPAVVFCCSCHMHVHVHVWPRMSQSCSTSVPAQCDRTGQGVSHTATNTHKTNRASLL